MISAQFPLLPQISPKIGSSANLLVSLNQILIFFRTLKEFLPLVIWAPVDHVEWMLLKFLKWSQPKFFFFGEIKILLAFKIWLIISSSSLVIPPCKLLYNSTDFLFAVISGMGTLLRSYNTTYFIKSLLVCSLHPLPMFFAFFFFQNNSLSLSSKNFFKLFYVAFERTKPVLQNPSG